MLNLLIKKQILEFISSLLGNKIKSKKQRNIKIILVSILLLYVFATFGVLVYLLSSKLCDVLNTLNLALNENIDWLYFVLFSFGALAFNLVSGIISSSTILYEAKDNDFLFSLPIKPIIILLSRVAELYLLNLIVNSVIFLPAYIAYFVHVKVSISIIISAILIMIFFPLLTTAISAVGGYLISALATKFKSKNFIKIIFTLSFLGAYFYITTFSEKILSVLMDSVLSSDTAESIKTYAYPFYVFGKGASGDVLSLVLFVASTLAILCAVLFLLSKKYTKLSTASIKSSKRKYKTKLSKRNSIWVALIKKEFRRFFGCASYFLNCGIGSLFAIAIGIWVLIKGDAAISSIIALEVNDEFLLPISCLIAAVCSMMTPVSAPSVSLEGESLWILQSLPIKTKEILNVKILSHIIFMAFPLLFLCFSFWYSFKFSIVEFALLLGISFAFVVLTDLLGIWTSLKFPNLHWKNEMVAVKQGAGTTVAILGTMGMVIAMCGIYVLFYKMAVDMILTLGLIFVLNLIFDIIMYYLIKTKGIKLFENL